MRKILLLTIYIFSQVGMKSQAYNFFTSPNSETVFYNALIPADSGLFFGMSKNNGNSSLYWLKNNQLSELKSVSSSSVAATFPDNIGSYKQWFTYGNKSLFLVSDPVPYKNTLWVSDGTSSGTDSLFSTSSTSANFYMGGMIGNFLYFTVTTLSPKKTLLYKTDFTKPGTTLVKTINNTNLFWPYVDNGTLYLHGYVGATASYDVLYSFTADTNRILLGYMYGQARVINNELYYGITSVLKKKNLTSNVITTLNNSFNFTTNQILGVFKNKIYIAGVNTTSGSPANIYTTDGTSNSLTLLTTTTTLNNVPSLYFNYIFGNNFGYFLAKNNLNHYALFVTDGSSAGTHQVQDLQGSGSSALTTASVMKMCGDKLYFIDANYATGNSFNTGPTLSSCDSTRGSLIPVNWGNSTNSSVKNIVNFQNKLVFTGSDPGFTYLSNIYLINSCESFSPLTVGILNFHNEEETRVYPNPSNGTFSIKLKNSDYNQLTLTNLMGKILLSTPLSEKETTINTAQEPGMYVIILTNKNGHSISQKLIIQ